MYTKPSSLRTLKIMTRNLTKSYVYEFGFWAHGIKQKQVELNRLGVRSTEDEGYIIGPWSASYSALLETRGWEA